MKSELRLHEYIFLAMLIILDIYLLNLNISVNDYEILKRDSSTANYLNIEEVINTKKESNLSIIEKLEQMKQEIIIEEEHIVYDNMTMDELASKIEKSLNSTISGKGYLIASHSIEKGVDPYMATAIILQETGCKWECSYLVKTCNNVGGQKGYGCGAYSYFNSLDEGIIAFIDNLYNNYISYGLITPEQINHKYAEDPNWSVNVNKYIEVIKAQ